PPFPCAQSVIGCMASLPATHQPHMMFLDCLALTPDGAKAKILADRLSFVISRRVSGPVTCGCRIGKIIQVNRRISAAMVGNAAQLGRRRQAPVAEAAKRQGIDVSHVLLGIATNDTKADHTNLHTGITPSTDARAN